MNNRIAICVGTAACVGMTALGMVGTASAQQMVYVEPPQRAYGGPPAAAEGGLPPNEILMVVRASGLRPLTAPARRGARYVILASDNMGGQLRVVIGAYDGRIINAAPAYDPRFAYHPVRPRGYIPGVPQHAAVQPYPAPQLQEPTPPLPRTARTTSAPQPPSAPPQTSRLASAPDTAAPAPTRPAVTPLPRPRPVIAANEAATTPAAPAAAPQAASRETSPEAETSPASAAAARPAPAAPSAAPATKPAAETQMVPVAPLD